MVRYMFDYDAVAELYFGGVRARRKIGYRRFSQASAAILYAIEQLGPLELNGAFLEVNDDRIGAAEIRSLYEHADFPLARRDAQ
jgi:hypothetical protein